MTDLYVCFFVIFFIFIWCFSTVCGG